MEPRGHGGRAAGDGGGGSGGGVVVWWVGEEEENCNFGRSYVCLSTSLFFLCSVINNSLMR